MKKKFKKNVCMSCRKSLKNRRNFFWRRNFFGGYCTLWCPAHERPVHDRVLPCVCWTVHDWVLLRVATSTWLNGLCGGSQYMTECYSAWCQYMTEYYSVWWPVHDSMFLRVVTSTWMKVTLSGDQYMTECYFVWWTVHDWMLLCVEQTVHD